MSRRLSVSAEGCPSLALCYPVSWHDLQRRANADTVWLHTRKIMPPSHSNPFRDGALSNLDCLHAALDRGLAAVVRGARWLALPLIALLFLQWPLRDGLHRFSREANDLGQIAFALYAAVAITAASRARAHLATDVVARRYSPRTRGRLSRIVALLVLAPWSAFVIFASWAPLRASLGVLEAFPDTTNPGYFVVKAGATLLVALVLAQALLELRPGRGGGT